MAVVGAALAALFGLVVERLRFGPPFVMLCLGGATLGWASVALWRVLAPLFEEEAVDQRARREAPHHRRELEREKQLVLKAIKEVELDFQMKKIAAEDYKDMSERYRARAMRLLAELDAGDDVRGLIERELKLRLAAARATADRGAPLRAASEPKLAPEPSPPAEAPPTGTCSSCGTLNDADAVFCKKCGRKVADGAASGGEGAS